MNIVFISCWAFVGPSSSTLSLARRGDYGSPNAILKRAILEGVIAKWMFDFSKKFALSFT